MIFFKQEYEDYSAKIQSNYSEKKKLIVVDITWPLQDQKAIRKNKRKQRKIKINSQERYQSRSSYDTSIIPEKTTTFSKHHQESTNQIQSKTQLFYTIICNPTNFDDLIRLFLGLQIHRNGGVIFLFGINHVSLGNSIGDIQRVEVLIPWNIVNIQRTSNNNEINNPRYYLESVKVQELLKTILQSNSNEFNQQLLSMMGYLAGLDSAQDITQITQIPGQLQEDQEKGFERFVSGCFDYLKNQGKLVMYAYSIGRIHKLTDEVEMTHTGYSKAYLDLIGVSSDILTSFLLRKKKLEILRENVDFTRLSMIALIHLSKFKLTDLFNEREFSYKMIEQQVFSEPVSYQIVTFDGFSVTLTQRLRLFYAPINVDFKTNHNVKSQKGYFFHFFELDIDLLQLGKLIQFRESLYHQCKGHLQQLPLKDFLERELSLMFEDVEYSVRSQEFLQKYYSNSLLSLNSMKQVKLLSKEQEHLLIRDNFKDSMEE